MDISLFCDESEYPPLKLEKPLRITQKPYKAVFNKRLQWCFHLSNGKVVNSYQLADVLGISQPSVMERMEDLEWNDPEMMIPGRRKKKRRTSVDLSHIPRGVFSHLSNKQRV